MTIPVITTLTAPNDKVNGEKPKITPSAPHLVGGEADEAVKALVDDSILSKYPRLERRFVDPPIELQKYGLISFVPSKDAIPDKNGVFGFAKIRGNFATVDEADLHAQELVKNVDSYHKIFVAHVGRPFPMCTTSDYSKDVVEVQLQKDISDVYSADVKGKRDKELKDMQEIQSREKNLTAEVKREVEDPLEYYTMIQTKRAHLIWTYKKTDDKMMEIRDSILKSRAEIEKLDASDQTLRDKYFERYKEARTASNLSNEQHADNFIKFMCEDIALPFAKSGELKSYEQLLNEVIRLREENANLRK
jgi:hypothetical protein